MSRDLHRERQRSGGLFQGPDGFEFHKITPGESSTRQDLDYIAGRYYPLPKHLDSLSKINEILETFPFSLVFEDVEVDGQVVGKQRVARALTELDGIVCVAGLAPAIWLYIKVSLSSPSFFLLSRIGNPDPRSLAQAHNWYGDRMTALVDAEQLSSVSLCLLRFAEPPPLVIPSLTPISPLNRQRSRIGSSGTRSKIDPREFEGRKEKFQFRVERKKVCRACFSVFCPRSLYVL